MKNIDKKEALITFSIVFFAVFIGIIFFINPIIQEVYMKGYERGKNESCNLGFKPIEIPKTHEDMTKNVLDSVNVSFQTS